MRVQNMMKTVGLLGVFIISTLSGGQEEIAADQLQTEQKEEQTIEMPASVKIECNKVEEAAPAAGDVKPIQSLIFKEDATVRDALRLLGMKYRKNIVPSSKVQGKLNVNAIYDVTFEEALDAILGYEYKYELEGNFVKVYTTEEYAQVRTDVSRMECRVFTLYYIPSEEAANLINPVLSPAAVITTSAMPETGLSSGDAVEVEEGGTSLSQFDTLVIKDYPENLEMVENLLETLDRRPVQVLIEATILSAKLTEGLELGVDINLLNGQNITGVANIAAGLPGTMMQSTGLAGTQTGNGMRVGVSSGNVTAFITALETVTDTTILANPKILALNKQVGTVFIGEKIGYRSSTTISDAGVATEGEVEFLDSGTKLSFRPYVGNDGYIRMDIYPKDSSAVLNDDGVPNETTAELATNIMVKDGETIVIGGLFRDEITTTKSQIPLLGDLPLLGALFRSTDDTSSRQEVIILLTCNVIEKPSEIKGNARSEDVSRKRFASIEGLQGIGVAKLAEEGYKRAINCYRQGQLDSAVYELDRVLKIRPTYLEAIRLKEMILEEKGCVNTIERLSVEEVEKEDNKYWDRRS